MYFTRIDKRDDARLMGKAGVAHVEPVPKNVVPEQSAAQIIAEAQARRQAQREAKEAATKRR